ncbi:TSR1 [[Candida] subhashii]|uniref:TSR1 n=1 Tax=[Candida] subhashii TaxID=561895 RepID=A0A8J5QH85_9ASCO|nr:TSR1 [[Candida] subhashii]KAG7660953.1 TSR1 [[Candida] subhashii]
MAGGHRKTLKNDHKPFKSKHSTKGQLKNQYKGKVEKSSSSSNKAAKTLSKLERKNLSKQLKDQKILETKLTRKLFEGNQGAEKIITIISLTTDISPVDIADRLFNQDDQAKVEFQYPSVNKISIARFKSNLKVIIPNQDNFLSILDAAKVSDFVIFGVSAQQEVEKEYGEQILRSLIAQGIATVIGVLPNVVSTYPKRNLQLDIKQSLQSYFDHFFSSTQEKLFSLELDSDNINCLRTICQKFPKSVTWRDSRGWLVADKVSWSTDTPESGHLVVEGTIRGVGFNVNRLVHIPGYGDFQVEKLEKISKSRPTRGQDMEMDEDNILDAYIPDENQESLDELNPEAVEMVEDDFEWDDNENNLGVRSEGRIYFDDDGVKRPVDPAKMRRLPKGTSEYQGRWFVDDILEDEDVSDVEEPEQADDDEMNDEMAVETEYAPTEYAETEMHVDLSPEEEERQLKQFRELEREDLDFPDELELLPNESAKERLAAFRGVKSLANCDWDFDEYDVEAPSIWNRLLRVSNYKATKNKINKEYIKQTQINAGNRARVYIRAPSFILERINPDSMPFTIYELLEHEHKLAVCNFSFESWEDYEKPIPAKESIIVQYGPRRQVISPLFNQASNNPNNVHKSETFAHLGSTVIATAIAPVLFNNAPVIYFKPGQVEGSLEFVGQGTFLNCDHTRIVAQRAVLTGHPVKIHKKVVTVRYMFFNPEDINFFKAISLFTKSGRTGFIKESLGTHGYFKATFDGKLTSQDVVAMSLYKRVWPEISTAWTD